MVLDAQAANPQDATELEPSEKPQSTEQLDYSKKTQLWGYYQRDPRRGERNQI